MKYISIMLATALPVFANAQSARVISGNHQDFARLVILDPGFEDWKIGRTTIGYALQWDNESFSLNLEEIYDLIPRDRISELQVVNARRLDIEVNCQCHLNAFQIPEGLVIDVIDGFASETNVFEEPLKSISTSDASNRAIELDSIAQYSLPRNWQYPVYSAASLSPRVSPMSADPMIIRNDADQAFSEFYDEGFESSGLFEAMNRWELQHYNSDPSLAYNAQQVFYDRLNQEFSLAAELNLIHQGMLPQTNLRLSDEGEEIAFQVETVSETVFFEQSAGPVVDQWSLLNVYDRYTEEKSNFSIDSHTPNCLPDFLFDFQSWGPSANNEFSLLRTSDLPVEVESKLELEHQIRRLLYYGFGSEANQLLEAIVEKSTELEIYGDLARFFDNIVLEEPIITPEMVACDGRASLWAALLHDVFPVEIEPAGDALTLTFSELPKHIRSYVAPILVSKLIFLGETGIAQQVTRSILRTDDISQDHAALINAYVMVANGDVLNARSEFERILLRDGSLAPRSAQNMLQTSILISEPISENFKVLIDAMIVENNGREIQSDLILEQIRASATSMNLYDLLTAVEDHYSKSKFSSEALDYLLREIFELAAQSRSDSELVRVVSHPVVGSASDRLLLLNDDLATRLYALGLGRVLQIGENKYNQSSHNHIHIIQSAKESMARGDFQGALDMLLAINDEEALSLLASSYAEIGEYGMAVNAIQELYRHPENETNVDANARLPILEGLFDRRLLGERYADFNRAFEIEDISIVLRNASSSLNDISQIIFN